MLQGLEKCPGKKVILRHPVLPVILSLVLSSNVESPFLLPLIFVEFSSENLRVHQDNISWLMIFVLFITFLSEM